MNEVYVVGGARTPMAEYVGALKDISALELGAIASRAAMEKTGVKPGPDETAPHWAFADGATEVAAARMLTYSAAQMLDRGENAEDAITRAHTFAANAAQRAVDAAIRVVGAAGLTRGGLLDRLSRDARTQQVILR